MTDWLTTSEAGLIAGVTAGSVREHAKKNGWSVERRDRVSPACGPPLWIVRRSDVEAYAAERARRHQLGLTRGLERKDQGKEVRELCNWVNGLTEWPSDEEIEERVTLAWRFTDIECMIDARVWRKDEDGEYLKPLREPAMKRDVNKRYIWRDDDES